MAVIQTALNIPDEIWAELLAGNYVRDGGVVRDLAGRLVKLLDEASPTADTQDVSRAVVTKALVDHRYVIFGLSAAAVTAAGFALWANRKKGHGNPELTAGAQRYNASLTAYLEAARMGNLDSDVIDRLLKDLEVVMSEPDIGEVATTSRPQQLETLVNIVADHTTRLAEANHLELSDVQGSAPDLKSSAMMDLRRYLEIQGRIIKGTD